MPLFELRTDITTHIIFLLLHITTIEWLCERTFYICCETVGALPTVRVAMAYDNGKGFRTRNYLACFLRIIIFTRFCLLVYASNFLVV